MSNWSSTYKIGRVAASEGDLLILPRDGIQGRRGIVMAHGAGATGAGWTNHTSTRYAAEFTFALAQAGLAISAADLGGTQTWGNDTVVARIEAARQILIGQGCASDKVLLLGASMGNLGVFSYARTYPSRVAAIVGLIPAIDIDDIRDNNKLGSKSLIEAAWGISSSDPLPNNAKPLLNTAAVQGIPYHCYYSTADTVTIPSAVVQLMTAVGGTATVISNSLDHSDAELGQMPVNEIVRFLYTYSK